MTLRGVKTLMKTEGYRAKPRVQGGGSVGGVGMGSLSLFPLT